MAKIELRDYQKQILDELDNLAAVGLFMDTGTGKTITSIEQTKRNNTKNLLVVCPKNVVEQWKHVLMSDFSGFHIIEFKKSWNASKINDAIKTEKYNTIILNFEMVYRLPNLLKIIDNSWTIIIDESHRIKAQGTRRSPVKVTNFILDLGGKTSWKIILTATPTQGNFGGYIDYYTQLKFLGYIDMPLNKFKEKYCIVTDKFIYGRPYPIPVIVGYKNTDDLDEILKTCCKRYVAKFGDFEPQHNKIELPRTPSYAKTAREKTYKDILLNNGARKRVGLKTLTTGTVYGLDFYGNHYQYEDNTIKLDWLEDFLRDTNETVAIFYQYNVELEALKSLMHKLRKTFITINGATENAYSEINDKDYDVMLGQFQSASQSLDGLQHKCHIEIFFALPESSLLHKQALGRINRDGQTKVPMYYYLIMEKTIEETIFNMIENKINYSEEVLDRLVIKDEEI